MTQWQHVPKTSLARRTREVLRAVQRGGTVVVEHHGQPEAAIIDIVDYWLLQAALHFHTQVSPEPLDVGLEEAAIAGLEPAERTRRVIGHYLAGGISLSRAAELLDLPPLDLRNRFVRLSLPLRRESADELPDDIAAAVAVVTDY